MKSVIWWLLVNNVFLGTKKHPKCKTKQMGQFIAHCSLVPNLSPECCMWARKWKLDCLSSISPILVSFTFPSNSYFLSPFLLIWGLVNELNISFNIEYCPRKPSMYPKIVTLKIANYHSLGSSGM